MVLSGGVAAFKLISIDTFGLRERPSYFGLGPLRRILVHPSSACRIEPEGEFAWVFLAARSASVTIFMSA